MTIGESEGVTFGPPSPILEHHSSSSSSSSSPTAIASPGQSTAEDSQGEVLRKVIGDLEVIEDEAVHAKVKRAIANQRQKLVVLLRAEIRNSVQKKWRKVLTGDESKRVRDHIREPPIARSIDKFAFTFGVLNLILSEFIVVQHPEHFTSWYMVMIPVLIFCRIPHYRSLKYLYFLFDFCYFTQILCMIQLYLFPASCSLLKANFLLANGPLAWAVPIWRNSLVFHEIEKITSLYIHIFPALLLYTLRWYPTPTSEGLPGPLSQCGASPMRREDIFMACGLYILWQIMYYAKTEIMDRSKLDADPELQTSLRWMAKDYKNPLHKAVLFLTRRWGLMGKSETFDHKSVKTKIIFITTQFVYTLITILPCLYIWNHYTAHITYGLTLITIAIFNGANYYIEVFSVRYATKYPRERPAGFGVPRVAEPPELKRSKSEGGEALKQKEL